MIKCLVLVTCVKYTKLLTVDSVTVAELPEYSHKSLIEKEVVRHQNVYSLASNHDVQ